MAYSNTYFASAFPFAVACPVAVASAAGSTASGVALSSCMSAGSPLTVASCRCSMNQ